MKLLLIFLLSLTCYAEDYIGLVDKDTGEITDIVSDTPKNRETWNKIKGLKEVKAFKLESIPNQRPLKFDIDTVVVDEVKYAEKQLAIAEEAKIQEKMRSIAIKEIAKEKEAIIEKVIK